MWLILCYFYLWTRSSFKASCSFFDRMEADLSLKGIGKQLSCIAKLIFYCGVEGGEIPELTIRDVIDQDGKIIRVIRNLANPSC